LGSSFKDKKVVQMYNNVFVTQFETLSQNVVRKKWRLTAEYCCRGDFIMSCPVLQLGFILLLKLITFVGLYSSAETAADSDLTRPKKS
jgi:hypothetical protein